MECAPKTHIIILTFISLQARIFQFSLTLNIHRRPVSRINMNIRSVWNVWHLFIYSFGLFAYSQLHRTLENIPFLASINKFIIKYLSPRNFILFDRILRSFFSSSLSFSSTLYYYFPQCFCHLSNTLMKFFTSVVIYN